ncbi:e79324f3-a69d-461f-94bd-cf8c5798e291 [Thermothielavioides terrestris]|uniref:E79324f3-a69d-461f-94bd-cf8c5798e291 n=1 Tax=Thermothielavioides terrestris TaxID=2587410 RepID=A0A3S4ATS0_9PEZI|nr:e79324f3-a69d-461f-94bd-cf8c5798e291 [Thermothielavioides terrestris]
MAWGRQHTQTPPSPVKQLLPLIITLVILSVVAWVGYQIYLSMVKIQAQARRQMGDNVVFTKAGVRVQVQDLGTESYVDKTQSWVVKAWNLGSASNAQDEATKRKRYVQEQHLGAFRCD